MTIPWVTQPAPLIYKRVVRRECWGMYKALNTTYEQCPQMAWLLCISFFAHSADPEVRSYGCRPEFDDSPDLQLSLTHLRETYPVVITGIPEVNVRSDQCR